MIRVYSRIKDLRARQDAAPSFAVPEHYRGLAGVPSFFAEQLNVVDEEKVRRQFILRPIQQKILAAEMEARRLGVPPWFIILKYRKGGVTTFEQGMSYKTIWEEKHQECLTLAHRPQDMRMIFRMVTRFYEHQPKQLRHQKTEAHVNWLEFPKMDGLYMSGSALAVNTGRGGTLSRVHLSEPAFYKSLSDIHGSLANSVGKNSVYKLESTPNGREGLGKDFFDFYQMAKAGESMFIPLFFAWHDFPQNRMAAPGGWPELEPLSPEEQELVDRFKLDPEQLAWWRFQRRKLVGGGGGAHLIHQEHPSDDDTCFLHGAVGYYDRETVAEAERYAREQTPIRIEDDRFGLLRIFEDPQDGCNYSLGIDPSGGTGEDAAAVVGINATTGRQAFAYENRRMPPDDLGAIVLASREEKDCGGVTRPVGLGWRYANPSTGIPAFTTTERDNHGHATLAGQTKIGGYPRDRIYHHTDPTQDPNDASASRTPGWPHTQVGHVALTVAIGKMLRDHAPILTDLETVRSIARVGSGPNGAIFTGRDLAVAAGLAVIGLPGAKEADGGWAWIGGQMVRVG